MKYRLGAARGRDRAWPLAGKGPREIAATPGLEQARGLWQAWPRAGQGPQATDEEGLALSAVRCSGRALGAAAIAIAAAPYSSPVKKKGSFMGFLGPAKFFF